MSTNVERLLEEAANAAVAQEISIEVFTLVARAAYVVAAPGLAAQLRDLELLEQLEGLHREGRLAIA